MTVQSYPTRAGLRWLYIFDLPRGLDGKRSQKKERGFPTAEAAAEAERAARRRVGSLEPAARGTVASELRAWIEVRKSDLKPTTVEDYRMRFEAYVIPWIGDQHLHRVDHVMISRLYRTLAERGGRRGGALAPSSVYAVHLSLMAALRDLGLRLDKVRAPRHPDIARRRAGKKQGRHGVWDDAQCIAFLRFHANDRLFAMWALAIVCGLRRGELCGLRWRWVDLDAGMLRVRRQRNSLPGRVIEDDPKGTSERDIPLGPAMVAVLRRHRAFWSAERARLDGRWRGEDFVFCSDRGRPYYPDHISHRFVTLVERSGLPRIALHDARHSSLTVSSAVAGVDIATLQGRSGHADPQVLTGIYLHALPAAARAASEAIESVLLPNDEAA